MLRTCLPVRRSVAVLGVVLGLSYQLAFPGISLAIGTTSCAEGPGAVNHWRGEALVAGQKHGTSATVPGRVLSLCTSPNPLLEIDGSFYFSNVEPASGSFRDIIQIGFGQGRSPSVPGGMYYYTGWGRSTSTAGCSTFANRDPLTTSAGLYDSAQHDYKVYHQTNFWRLLVDSTQKVAIGESEICWTPGKSSWFGETWDSGDQLGGSQSSHLPVTLMNYANAEDGGFFWTNFDAAQACNYSAAPPAAYSCDITDTRTIEIWTQDR